MSNFEEKNNNEEKKIKKAERSIRDLQITGVYVIVFALALWILFGWIIGFATMPNNDMYPRLDAGDLVLYYRIDKDVKAQDVIVFEKNDTRYIARVVAVAGDTVEITDDEHLVINGNKVIENNIYESTPRYNGYTEYPLTLGDNECFVLVDKRSGGEDSRYYGAVNRKEIIGTVITIARRNAL